jgi:hypothetical protein
MQNAPLRPAHGPASQDAPRPASFLAAERALTKGRSAGHGKGLIDSTHLMAEAFAAGAKTTALRAGAPVDGSAGCGGLVLWAEGGAAGQDTPTGAQAPHPFGAGGVQVRVGGKLLPDVRIGAYPAPQDLVPLPLGAAMPAGIDHG